MNNTTNNNYSGGLSLGTILFIVFLVLKLTHVIDWSWWWVTCPLWAGVALVLTIALGGAALCGLIVGACALVAAVIAKFRK